MKAPAVIEIALGATALLIATLAYLANPDLSLFRGEYYEIVKRPPRAPSGQIKKLLSSCEATAQYRYNSARTGVAPSTAKPTSHPKILKHIFPLNVDIHGASKSSPTIDETGIYLGSDAGWFWKMDHDGNIQWSFYVPGSENGIHGSAAIDDKKVYIGTYNGFLYALDKSDGNLVWANPVANYIGASPLLANGALFITGETPHPDGLLAKLDCNTGETLWVSQWLGGHSHSSPSYDPKSGSVLAGANSGRFYSFDEKSGETLWEKQLGGPNKGTPLILDEDVYFGSWDKHYHAYKIKSGEEKWATFMGGRIQTSLTPVPGADIGITNTKVGFITGLNLKNGEILWRLMHQDGNHQFSVLVTEDPERKGEYLAWSRCKQFQLCILDGKTGKLLKNIDLPGSFTSVPFAWKDRVYISLDKNQGMVILQ